jgi:hypothetical protein
MMMKIKKNSFFLGLSKAYNIPLLPNIVQDFLSNIYVRILRFIGGLCVILVLTQIYLKFPNFLH